MFFRSFPSFLNIKSDVFLTINSEVGVRSHIDGEVVGSFLAGSCELKLNLLFSDERCEMVGRSDQRVSLSV